MKGIFIAYDQAYNMEVADAIQKIGVRGFTMWQDIAGRGSQTGEPHLGNHAWPTMNNAMLTFVPDEMVDPILTQIKAMDEETPDLGLRAFVWNVENYSRVLVRCFFLQTFTLISSFLGHTPTTIPS